MSDSHLIHTRQLETKYFRDKSISYEYTHINGVKDGPSYSYYPYDQNQQTQNKQCLVSGIKQGKLWKRETYKHGRLHGIFTEFYDINKIKKQTKYRYGELHGSFKQYHLNGKLHIQCQYIEGKLDGQYQVFDYYGKLIYQYETNLIANNSIQQQSPCFQTVLVSIPDD